MIVIRDSYHKQCSSIPFCTVKLGSYSVVYLCYGESESRGESETLRLKNLADVYPIYVKVDFSGTDQRNEALSRLNMRYELWHNQFYISVPSYKQIKAIKNYLEEIGDYSRTSYNELPLINQKIRKGYIVSLCEKGNGGGKKLLLVYDSLAAAQRAKERYCSYRYNPDPKYSLWSWYVSRVVISLSNPIAIFGSYDSHMIGYWWCKIFSACLDESRKPKSTAYIFFHYHLDPDKNEIRYES